MINVPSLYNTLWTQKVEQMNNRKMMLVENGYTHSEPKTLNCISFMHSQGFEKIDFNTFKGNEYLIKYASQEQFDYVVERLNDEVKLLVIGVSPKIKDFTSIESLNNLEYICIKWNNTATRLWDMGKNLKLKEVALAEFKKLNSLEDFKTAGHIKGLQLDGGLEVKWKVENFEPLTSLVCLKILRLFEIMPKIGGFEPLFKLLQLERLDISQNILSTEEYAKLAAHLNNTYSEVFNGVLYDEYLNEILLVGKGKRALILDKVSDREKAEKFRNEFLHMVKSYQEV